MNSRNSLKAFSVIVSEEAFGPGREGVYTWTAPNPEYWIESRGSKIINRYQFFAQAKFDNCKGAIFDKMLAPAEQVFIPDDGCAKMVLKYSSGHGWNDVGTIEKTSMK
jgi:hypothetical protein